VERRARLHLLRPLARSAAAAVVLGIAAARASQAKVFLTAEEALRLAFPGAAVERKSAFLTPAQQEEARRLSGADRPPGGLVTYYVASRPPGGAEVGRAYFDTHVVRTQTETVMIVVDPGGAIARVEVLSFAEPDEYLPRSRWYSEFQGRKLDGELMVKRGIPPVAGATLTARATTDAARRILALERVVRGAAPEKHVTGVAPAKNP